MLVSAIHHIVKKAFLSEQSKKIEKNNRMGKTRDLFKKIGKKKKKIGDIKGIFHARMSMRTEMVRT